MSVSRDVLDSLHTSVTKAATARGIDWRLAVEIAFAVEQRLREDWGGRRPYVKAPNVTERHRLIFAAFDGTNGDEVCSKFGISRRTLQRIRQEFRED